jgi:hypothetical protein
MRADVVAVLPSVDPPGMPDVLSIQHVWFWKILITFRQWKR